VLRSRRLGAIPLPPQYVFMAWCLGKHKDNFTFYLCFTYIFPVIRKTWKDVHCWKLIELCNSNDVIAENVGVSFKNNVISLDHHRIGRGKTETYIGSYHFLNMSLS